MVFTFGDINPGDIGGFKMFADCTGYSFLHDGINLCVSVLFLF